VNPCLYRAVKEGGLKDRAMEKQFPLTTRIRSLRKGERGLRGRTTLIRESGQQGKGYRKRGGNISSRERFEGDTGQREKQIWGGGGWLFCVFVGVGVLFVLLGVWVFGGSRILTDSEHP